MVEVEIKGHYGQFIKGYLRRFVDDKAVIAYCDDPNSEEIIPLSELRLPPKNLSESLQLAPQQHVEAFLLLNLKEDERMKGFAEALANLSAQPPSSPASRLTSPFACLTCPSWWPCVVTKVRDDHAVVQLTPTFPEPKTGAPKEYNDMAKALFGMTEICERKTLRPASGDIQGLKNDCFFTHKIELPHELIPFASDPVVHESMLKRCPGPASIIIDDGHLIVLSPSEEVIRVTVLLEEMHLRMLRQKHALVRYIYQSKRTSEPPFGNREGRQSLPADGNTWCNDENHFVESFQLPLSLMGLAIGTQGSNIRTARAVEGVVHIDVKEPAPSSNMMQRFAANAEGKPLEEEVKLMATFQVVAENQAAAKAARAILEYYELCLLVPQRLIGRILGAHTANIMAVSEKSGVKHIHLEENTNQLPRHVDELTNDPTHLPRCLRVNDIHPHLAVQQETGRECGFFIVGTREAVEKARLLITFHIDSIFDLEKLEAQKIGLIRDLPPRERIISSDQEPREYWSANGGGPRRSGRGGRGRDWAPRSRDIESGPTNQHGSGDPGEDGEWFERGQFRQRGGRRQPYNDSSRQRWPANNGPIRSCSGDMFDHNEGEQGVEQSKLEDGEATHETADRRRNPGTNLRRGGGPPGRRMPFPKEEVHMNGEINNEEKGVVSKGQSTADSLKKLHATEQTPSISESKLETDEAGVKKRRSNKKLP